MLIVAFHTHLGVYVPYFSRIRVFFFIAQEDWISFVQKIFRYIHWFCMCVCVCDCARVSMSMCVCLNERSFLTHNRFIYFIQRPMLMRPALKSAIHSFFGFDFNFIFFFVVVSVAQNIFQQKRSTVRSFCKLQSIHNFCSFFTLNKRQSQSFWQVVLVLLLGAWDSYTLLNWKRKQEVLASLAFLGGKVYVLT